MSKVSLIVPVFNTPKSLFIRCMDSLLDLDLEDYEIIVVNDGSNDVLGGGTMPILGRKDA